MCRILILLFFTWINVLKVSGQKFAFFNAIHNDGQPFIQVEDIALDKIGRYWVVSQQKLYIIENGKSDLASVYYNFSINQVVSVAVWGDELYILGIDGSYAVCHLISQSIKTYKKPGASKLVIQNSTLLLSAPDGFYTVIKHEKVSRTSSEEIKYNAPQNPDFLGRNGAVTVPFTQGKILNLSGRMQRFHGQDYVLEDGVIYHYNHAVNRLTEYFLQPNLIDVDVRTVLPLSNGSYFVSLNKIGGIYMYSDGVFIDIGSLPQNRLIANSLSFGIIFHAVETNDGVILCLSGSGDIYEINTSTWSIHKNKPLSSLGVQFKNIFCDRSGMVWTGTYADMLVRYNPYDKTVKVWDSRDCSQLYDTYRIYEDHRGLIWLGMIHGLIALDPVKNQFKTFDSILSTNGVDLNKVAISALGMDDMDRLWIGTYEYGLHYINYSDIANDLNQSLAAISLIHSKKYMEYDIKYVNHHKGVLWVRSKNGLSAINSKDFATRVWTVKEGFPVVMNNNYNHIQDDKYYIFGCNGGIGRFLINEKAPMTSTIIKSLFVNGHKSPLLYPLAVGHSTSFDDDISIIQLSLAYGMQLSGWSKISYRYNDTISQSPIDQQIALIATQKGKKSLSFELNYGSLLYEEQAYDLDLNLKKAWYKTKTFIAFLFVLLSYLLYLLYRYYDKSRVYKNIADTLEMESLRSQMNPHFISNALNSINYYILENKTDEASQFIIKFSKLIRKILNNTSREYITIQEEIDSLRMYIDMEKMRFKDKFSYRIVMDDEVDKFYEVPSMILQPLVENALWHGIMQKGQPGQLTVYVQKSGSQIQVIIEDDGIGIEKAKHIKSKQSLKRKSFGQNIVRRRLELLNNTGSKTYSKQYETLHNADAEYPGTRVILRL